MGMSDHSITTLGGCYYHHPYNKSKRISRLGSYDPTYYDQVITKLNLQSREEYVHRGSIQRLLQDQ
jgi:hypothetical protein